MGVSLSAKQRSFPVGAEVRDQGVDFRVWAPNCQKVELVIEDRASKVSALFVLQPEESGYFSGFVEALAPGTLYRFRLDGHLEKAFPDPASRFQPFGPHGPSQIIDPYFAWTDQQWKGVTEKNKVILYELHLGTFTEEGTWRAAAEKLSLLAEMGINVIEVMPIAEFSGRFNWGYDGVNLYAPSHHYGTPEECRFFVNQAHLLGLAVILDVVYNHFGPEGNYLSAFSRSYTKNVATEWGEAINFDGADSQSVRSYFIHNAGYWMEEFHFDGLRLDACHAIQDNSPLHVLIEIVQEARRRAGTREIYLIAENEAQQSHFVVSESQGGYGLDGVWNEDFHHSAYVRLTGHNEAYFTDYTGRAQEFVSSVKYGFLYQGQWYQWQNKRRGTPAFSLPPSRFINFLENHDQVSNSRGSLRLISLSQPGLYRALVTLLLLSPQTPLIFQGQEWGATTPFHYFSDQPAPLCDQVFTGRTAFMSQFDSLKQAAIQATLPPPHSVQTWKQSLLNWKAKNPHIFQLFKDLIGLRKNDPVFSNFETAWIDGACLSEEAFVVRYRNEEHERLLIVNCGADQRLLTHAEPLLAPASGQHWVLLWSSERPEYGGFGWRALPAEQAWWLSGYMALVLKGEEDDRPDSSY